MNYERRKGRKNEIKQQVILHQFDIKTYKFTQYIKCHHNISNIFTKEHI